MASTPNPYAVTTLEMSTASLASPEGAVTRRFRWVVAVTLTFLVVGTLAACYEIFTIVYSGPVLFGVGLMLAVLTRSGRQPGFRFLTWSCLAFPIFCLALINVFSWGPGQAQLPISILSSLFSLSMFVFSLVALHRSRIVPPAEDGFFDPISPDSSDPHPMSEPAAD